VRFRNHLDLYVAEVNVVFNPHRNFLYESIMPILNLVTFFFPNQFLANYSGWEVRNIHPSQSQQGVKGRTFEFNKVGKGLLSRTSPLSIGRNLRESCRRGNEKGRRKIPPQ